jgi:hypothetical protein
LGGPTRGCAADGCMQGLASCVPLRGILHLLTALPCSRHTPTHSRIVYLPGLEEEDLNVDDIICDGHMALQQ